MKTKIFKSLYAQVLTAVIIGVLLGYFYPKLGESMKPLGDGFIKLIKMIIAPIIFCTVVSGIAGMESMKSVGKTGGLALLYFEIVSTIALIVGLVIVNVIAPGSGMNIDPSTIDMKSVAAYTDPKKMQSTTDFIMAIIPNTLVDAFAKGEILQVLLIAIMFGFSLHALGQKGRIVFDFIDKISHVFFNMVSMIMRLAPIGAFGAMAFTIGKYGVGTLLSLGKLMGTFYLTCLVFVFGVLGLIAMFHGFSIWKFVKYIKEELLIVLGTSSSESVLPRMMSRMESLGASKSSVGLVIPTGYSFNLDGSMMYCTFAVIFIAQAYGIPLTVGQQVTMMLLLMVTSKGMAGVPRASLVVIAATLTYFHLPEAGLLLILAVDHLLDMGRSATNVVGNTVASVVVAKWEGELGQAEPEMVAQPA